jgi:hypothetical protein
MGDDVNGLPARVERLARSVDARFDAVDARFDAVDARFDAVDAKFDAVDARFDAVEEHLSDLRQYIDFGHFKLQEHITATSNELRLDVKTDISRLERKLDQFIDIQLKR